MIKGLLQAEEAGVGDGTAADGQRGGGNALNERRGCWKHHSLVPQARFVSVSLLGQDVDVAVVHRLVLCREDGEQRRGSRVKGTENSAEVGGTVEVKVPCDGVQGGEGQRGDGAWPTNEGRVDIM